MLKNMHGSFMPPFGTNITRKRPRDEDGDYEEESHYSEEESHVLVKKKLRTIDYFYQQLFVNGAGSDITICALGKEWKLHKICLSQSPYFSSMFSGAWKEANQGNVSISIPNKMITVKSLDQAFGSLYRDEIEIDSSEVTSLLAAASLLQLDYLISQCTDVMCENITFRNVISYYECGEENGLLKVQEKCLCWLQRNLLQYSNDVHFLRSINKDRMIGLVSSNDLVAIQSEINIYNLLKKWTFVRLNKQIDASYKVCKDKPNLMFEADKWFNAFKESAGRPQSFLETQSGRDFVPVFSTLRLHNILILDKVSQSIIDDNIIPRRTIEKCLALKWQMQMCVESEFKDRANSSDQEDSMVDRDFYKSAVRCGRVVQQDTTQLLRWSGFNHGVNVVMICRNRLISVKQSRASYPCPYSMNLRPSRTIYYKLDAFSFGPRQQIIWSVSTGICKVVLKAEEDQSVLTIPDYVAFPVTLAFWYAVPPFNAKSRRILDQFVKIWSSDDSLTDWPMEQCSSTSTSYYSNLASLTGDSSQTQSSN